MTSYDFNDESIYDKYDVPAESTSDNTKMVIRRGVVDFSKQNMANAQVANVINIYTGEIVHDVLTRVITGCTALTTLDIGYAGGAEVATEFIGTTANFFNANVTLVPTYFAADNVVTLAVNNGTTLAAGKVEVMAVITESLFD